MIWTGERITLRRPEKADAGAVFERWASDPEATRFMAWPTHETIEDANTFIQMSNTVWEKYGYGPMLIVHRESGKVIGSAGFMPRDATATDTGYILGKTYWGQGLASEALTLCVEYAPALGIKRLCADIHPSNIASRSVAKKCGFVIDTDMSTGCCIFPQINPEIPLATVRYVLDLGEGA